MTPFSSGGTEARSWSAGRTRAAIVVVALAAIPVLMVTLDPIVARQTVPHYGSPAVERLLAVTDPLGNAPLVPGVGGVLLVLALILRSGRMARIGVLVLLVFGLCGGAAYSVKSVVRRPRPWTQGLAWSETIRDWKWSRNGQAHSFPSGDVTIASGLAMALYLALRRGRARYLVFLIPLVSASGRIIGARHHPSDCLAGLLLGIGLAALAWRAWPEGTASDLKHEDTKPAKRHEDGPG
ncbi:MAG: phosphatase PAP2 family protein [Armatimonadetes bacterium]|nr:phosphatase PAP2 family protein [Armatimonadota bacterium]